MKIELSESTIEYEHPLTNENCVFVRGRARNTVIRLPEEWKEFVDPRTITIHLTPIGANQNILIKRIQGFDVHLQTNGLPVDCFYLAFGERLDIPRLKG